MTDVEALLAAIREEPDDPAPWSVYSDWLQAQNDPNGELIALQLERARCIDTARLAELDDRITAVYRPDGTRWCRSMLPSSNTPMACVAS